MEARKVIIIADIRDESALKNTAISLYQILEKSALVSPAFYAAGDQAHITKNYPNFKVANSISSIKNATFIMMREINNFFEIDRSNKVVYFANGKTVDYFISFILPRIDVTIATNYATAFRLAALSKQLNINTPIHRIPLMYDYDALPPTKINDESLILAVGSDERLKSLDRFNIKCDVLGDIDLINGTKIKELPDLSKYDYLVYFDTKYDHIVYEAMLRGLVVIAQDRLPFNEYIVNNINGYLASSEDSIGHAIAADNTGIVSANLALRDETNQGWWPKYFLDTIDGIGAENLQGIIGEIKLSERRWIIPKMVLHGDKEISIPTIYDTSVFKAINEQDLEHILIFFSSQQFREVYIFGWEYGNRKDIQRTNKIINLIRAYGRRIINIYWCTDDEIPKEWQDIFSNLSLMSVAEASKRVRPISNI